jgi:predicted PhzF superfamily epimerase YddE/YHI9
LNAGLAQWLIGTNRLPKQYVAAQGSALNRNGRVYVHDDGTDIWVGGHTRTLINGSVDLD